MIDDARLDLRVADFFERFLGVLQRVGGVFKQVGDRALTLRRYLCIVKDGAGHRYPQWELERQLAVRACEIDLDFDNALQGFDNGVVKRNQNVAVAVNTARHVVAEQIVFVAVEHHPRDHGRAACINVAPILLERYLDDLTITIVNMRDSDQFGGADLVVKVKLNVYRLF